MKRIPRAIIVLISGTCMALVSCASVRNVGKGSVQMVKKSTSATASKITSIGKAVQLPDLPDISLASLLPGSRIKVVEVREDELEDLPSGHDRALAYQQKRKQGFWIFGGPVDFEEPSLPEPGSELDGSLLPPRTP